MSIGGLSMAHFQYDPRPDWRSAERRQLSDARDRAGQRL